MENAADLIEQAGLKGARCGDVEVSSTNANFFVVSPNGTSDDVLRLMDQVRSQVVDQLGVKLETAIEVW